MKTVKSILFTVELSGKGVVNFDSNDQKYMYNGTNLKSTMGTMHDNVSYAKKHFYKDADGKLSYKLSISSDCLRHDIFKQDVMCQSPNIANNDALLYSYMASPAMMLRGYLFADKSATYKRKSAVTITDAEQTCNAVTHIDVHSSSAKKNADTDKETSDNTFFYKENIGDISYKSRGVLDIMQLQFVSADQKFDRFAFNPDAIDVYRKFMSSRLPMFDSELAYYNINGSVSDVPELGLLFNDACVIELVRMFFRRLQSTNILRKDSYAKVSKVKYKLVYDAIYDTFDDVDGWVTLVDADAIDFKPHVYYTACDNEAAIELIKQIDADVEKRKDDKKKEKEDKKKKEKEDKKNTKNKEVQQADDVIDSRVD